MITSFSRRRQWTRIMKPKQKQFTRKKASVFRVWLVMPLLWLLPVLAGGGTQAQAQPKVFNVREFGAAGDGRTLDTKAIQKALDTCGKAGGGTVRFPAGTYLSQPLTLRT